MALRALAALVLLLNALTTFGEVTNIVSSAVSFQFQDDATKAGTANGGISSQIVSFRYLDDFGNAPIMGDIASRLVSYQYYEWPGDDIAHLLKSSSVSYFWQVGTGCGSSVLRGRVTDVNGTPLSGATVWVTILFDSLASGISDVNGNYQIPNLESGVYTLWARHPTHRTTIRGLTFNSTTSEQDFQLFPLPNAPSTIQTSQQPSVNYTIDAKMSRLLYFNGSAFVTIDAMNKPSSTLRTVVLTHGWVVGIPDAKIMTQPFDRWPTNMAPAIANQLSPTSVNIVAWDWRYAAMDPFPAPSHAVDLTPDQGIALGEALQFYLGPTYSQQMHFVGHSLGTIVNAAAVNYLHGDHNGNAQRPATTIPWSNPIHLTLFDEAEIVEVIGANLLQQAVDPSVIDALKAAFVNNRPPVNWQSPLPNSYNWADNYESLVGATLFGAVNIWLQKAPQFDFWDPHGYPHEWYNNSVANPSDAKNKLGFQNSYEYSAKTGNSFIASSLFNYGDVYHQIPTDSDPLALEKVSGIHQTIGPPADFVITGSEELWQGAVKVAGQVEITVKNEATQVENAAVQDFNYVTTQAQQGYQTIINGVTSAFLHIDMSTQIAALPQNYAPKGPVPYGQTNSTSTPMVWLPISVPSNVYVMVFDFTLSGDSVDDVLVCGIGTNNLFSLSSKYIPTNSISTSRFIDVSQWAGTTNEIFFGFMGGTSTNATLGIDNIRFYSLELPQLNLSVTNGTPVLSWPLSAGNYVLETSPFLAPAGWETVTNAPTVTDRYVYTNTWLDQTRFFRLRQR